MSYKAIFALYVTCDWDINHMDVKTAFFTDLLKRLFILLSLQITPMNLHKCANFENHYMA